MVGAFPISRFFRLSDNGVRCDETGLFIGGAPMFTRVPGSGRRESWQMRPLDDQNNALSACYGFPVDITVKRDALAAVAQALQRGDVALAQISALLLRLPEPLSLAKDAPANSLIELARQLFASGLLKADWDSSKHPRTGEPPNAGWFAPKDETTVQVAENDVGPRATMTDATPTPTGFAPIVDERKPLVPQESEVEPPPSTEPEPEPTPAGAPESKPAKLAGSSRGLLKTLRDLLKLETYPIVQAGSVVDWATEKLSGAIDQVVATLKLAAAASPGVVDEAMVRSLQEALAAQDPPRTLAQLQTRPAQNAGGYDDHHLVQQNDININKSVIENVIEKFGWNVINAPSNRIWIPRIKHRIITDYYAMKYPDNPGRRRREVVRDMDYDAQYADALRTLRLFGVLQ